MNVLRNMFGELKVTAGQSARRKTLLLSNEKI